MVFAVALRWRRLLRVGTCLLSTPFILSQQQDDQDDQGGPCRGHHRHRAKAATSMFETSRPVSGLRLARATELDNNYQSGDQPDTRRKDSSMYKTLIISLTTLSLVAAVPLLSACHTTAGAGQDISATGQAIDKAAKKATP